MGYTLVVLIVMYSVVKEHTWYVIVESSCNVASQRSQKSVLYPRYEVYRGYIVFAFSVIKFVCLFVCLSVNFFFCQRFLSNYLT